MPAGARLRMPLGTYCPGPSISKKPDWMLIVPLVEPDMVMAVSGLATRIWRCPMIRPLAVAVLCALPLAGCGQGPTQADTTNIVVPSGDYAERLRAMTANERNAVFYRAINDAGRDCQQVRESSALEPVDGAPSWAATCEDGGRWIIVIGKDGIAQVTNAAELEASRPTMPAGGN